MALPKSTLESRPGLAGYPGRFRWALLFAIIASFCAKIYCAATTVGSNDVALFFSYAQIIDQHGLRAAYSLGPLFNHPPLAALAFGYCLELARSWEIPFPLLFRVPGIGADVVTTLAVLWVIQSLQLKIPRAALLLFAASPVAFMVTGYHGNTDPILVMLLTLSVIAGVLKRPIWCGALFALSLQIKVAPLVVAPVLFFFWLHRRQAWSFCLSGAGVTVLTWLPVLFVCPLQALHNVLGYSSYWGSWGITSWLWMTHWSGFDSLSYFHPTGAQKLVVLALKLTVCAGVTLIAWHRRTQSPEHLMSGIASAWMIFMALSPGVCPQYLVWPAPFLLLAAPRLYVGFTIACSGFLFAFYTATAHQLPWKFSNSTLAEIPLWLPWTFWPWLVAMGWLWGQRAEFRAAARSLAASLQRNPPFQPAFSFMDPSSRPPPAL